MHARTAPTDVRNHHAHLLLTTRKVGPEGLGAKSELELENRKLVALGLPTVARCSCGRAGSAGRSRPTRSWRGPGWSMPHRPSLAPGVRAGDRADAAPWACTRRRWSAAARQVERGAAGRSGGTAQCGADPREARAGAGSDHRRAERVRPARHRAGAAPLRRRGPGAFQAALAQVMASPALVELQAEQRDEHGRVVEPARYSTRRMVALERAWRRAPTGSRQRPGSASIAGASRPRSSAAVPLWRAAGGGARTSPGRERIAAVVGLAGAGKSTMLGGGTGGVGGGRLPGAWGGAGGQGGGGPGAIIGIASRTLASWERALGAGLRSRSAGATCW